jgi:acetyltransferase-like isoleucine patch superfamily enzyme
MTSFSSGRTLPFDWYPGMVPDNVEIDDTAYLDTSYVFAQYRSEAPIGLRIGYGASLCKDTVLDVGIRGQVSLGNYALVTGAWISCDARVEIGDYALISWGVVLMDTYRVPLHAAKRRHELEDVPLRVPRRLESIAPARPVRIGRNAWIGFDACVLPGVTIGEATIVGARSVVTEDVPAYSIVAGNPARVIRRVQP